MKVRTLYYARRKGQTIEIQGAPNKINQAGKKQNTESRMHSNI